MMRLRPELRRWEKKWWTNTPKRMLFNRWFIELINKSDQLKTMVVRNRSKAETTERTTIPEFGMHFMQCRMWSLSRKSSAMRTFQCKRIRENLYIICVIDWAKIGCVRDCWDEWLHATIHTFYVPILYRHNTCVGPLMSWEIITKTNKNKWLYQ